MVFEFFRKYLFSKRAGAAVRRISWLTIFGLGISVAALVIVLSVMTALNRSVLARTLSVEPHLTLELVGASKVKLVDIHPATQKVRMNPDLKANSFEVQDVILRTLDGRFSGAVARGLTTEGLDQVLNQSMKANGKDPFAIDFGLGKNEVILGSDLAIILGVFEGDEILVVPPESLLLPPGESPHYDRVRVRRIVSTSLADIDSQSLFYVQGNALGKLESSASRRVGIEVWMKDPSEADELKKSLETFPDIRMQTWKEKNSSLFLALRIEKVVIGMFLMLAALVAGFSLISVLVLLISQKRKEIGILQAVGFSTARIRKLFSSMGMMLAGCGLLGGLAVGTAVSLYLEKYPLHVLPDIYYDSSVPAYLDWGFVATIFVIGTLLAYLASHFSSQAATQVTPTEALRAHN